MVEKNIRIKMVEKLLDFEKKDALVIYAPDTLKARILLANN